MEDQGTGQDEQKQEREDRIERISLSYASPVDMIHELERRGEIRLDRWEE